MRKEFGIAALAVLTALPAPAFAVANLTVQVNNAAGGAVASAEVMALAFVNGSPDAAQSRLAMTDATGKATFDNAGVAPFSALVTGVSYQILASSQGFLPSLVDQFNAGSNGLTAAAPSATPASVTVALSTASSLGEIGLNFTNATHNSVIFGQVNLKTGGGAVAYGVTNTDGAGAGILTVHNLHYATGGTYQINAFDPQLNRSLSFNVASNLDAGTPSIAPGALPTADFGSVNAAPPSTAIDNTAGQGGTGLSADIVIVDTATGSPVPNAGVSVTGAFQDAYSQWHYDNRGGQSDSSGHVQLYGLTPNVIYYTSVYGTCAGATCYRGAPSTAVTAGYGTSPGPNDFLYTSTTTVVKRVIGLSAVAASTAKVGIFVQDQLGNPLPHSGVSLYPDFTPWYKDGTCTTQIPNPGMMNINTSAATGYVELSGMPSGNYMLSAYTQFGAASYNNAVFNSSVPFGGCNALNNYRLYIDTANAPYVARTYNGGGALMTSYSSATIVVQVSTSSTGLVQGTLTFPSAVNLSLSPVLITLYAQCNPGSPCNGGGYGAFTSASTGPVINYAIPVSSGQSYWMSVTSDYWGAITAGGSQLQVDLKSSTAAYVPIKFAAAGRVKGSMRAPDGSVFVPQNNQYVWVGASGNNSWGNTQLGADGSFDIGGLLPGVYRFQVGVGGSGPSSKFPYTTRRPEQQIQITANQDTLQDAYLDYAVGLQPTASLASLPALSIAAGCPQDTDCPPQTYEMFALPAGTKLGASAMVEMLAGDPSSSADSIAGRSQYNVDVGSASRCNGGQLNSPGFCPIAIPAKPGSGSTYDFYLARRGGFDSGNVQGGVRPHLVLVNASSNVVVAQSKAATPVFNPYDGPNGSTSTVQTVSLTPATSLASTPLAVLFGTFTMTNMITQQQFNSLGGKFDNFLNYLPVVYVYDTSGVFKAAGLGVPFPPAERPFEAQLKGSVSNSNYTQFQNLTGVSGWGPLGYEIRGLTAGTTYNIVATSPNYPPYKTSVTLGVAGSTTIVNVNFDANPGSTLQGVVTTTNSVNIPSAQVTVSAPGYTATTLTTDASGRWSITGLSAGRYSLSAVVAGYVSGAAIVDVSAGTTVTAPVFAMTAANASISGTVFTNNPVCPAGSTGCAAFGRTAISGATVVAYDDTLNASNPTAPLPLFRAVTSSSGTYTLTGLTSGDNYKVFVNAPGYYVLNQSTLTVAGNRPGFDFALKPKPLTVDVYGRPTGTNYEFQITNYKQFSTGSAWIGKSPFTKATSTDVSTLFHEQPDAQGVNQLLLDVPLSGAPINMSTGTVYVMHLEAQPNDPSAATVTTEVQFGLNLPHNTCQNIDQALLGDESSLNSLGLPANAVPIDISGGSSGNSTALSLPAGGVIPITSTAIPSMCMSETDASASSQAQAPGVSSGSFASGVYTMTLSSVNYTQKGVDLTLSYNQNGSSINDLAVYTYDSAQQKWQSVPGLQTLDPVKGTITVKGLKSLSSVLGLKGAQGTGLMAISDGRGYRPSAIILRPDDTGVFAVMKPSQVSGGAFSGTVVKVFNFPNPFSLQTKSVTLNTTAGVCAGLTGSVVTDGTVIKYEIPAGISGTGVIRIYTLSGRLVREVDAGNISPSTCYYTTWDGKNKNGQPVANGVYYGVLSVGGSKQSSGTFKLAVIK